MSEQQQQQNMTDDEAAALLAEAGAEVRVVLFDNQLVPASVETVKLIKGSGEQEGRLDIYVVFNTDGVLTDTNAVEYPPGHNFRKYYQIKAPSRLSGEELQKADSMIQRDLSDLDRLGKATGNPLKGPVSVPWMRSVEKSALRLHLKVKEYTSKKTGEVKQVQNFSFLAPQ